MQYTHLGRSGARVSRLALGTMNLGSALDEQASHALLDRALEHGVSFVDTADLYGGGSPGEGVTERVIGSWLAASPGRRDEVFLATKAYFPTGSGPNDRGLSAVHIRRACEDSLRRLGTDHIDLYQMHHIDRATPFDEVWEAFILLRQQGKIIYAGSSNFAGWHIAQAQEAARARHMMGLVAEQSIHSLMSRWIELEVLPAAQHYGLGVIAYSPVHGGMLSGVLRKQREGRARRSGTGIWAMDMDRHLETLQAYEDLCDELGHDPSQVALAWVLSRPGITAPVIGPRTIEQLDSAVAALDVTLDDATLERLEELFPAPGLMGARPAPEAYTV